MNKKIIGIAIIIIIAIIGVILIAGTNTETVTYKNITLGDCAIEVTNDTNFNNSSSVNNNVACDSYTIYYNVSNTAFDINDSANTTHYLELSVYSSSELVSSVDEYMDNCKKQGDNISNVGTFGNWTIFDHQYSLNTVTLSSGEKIDMGDFSIRQYEIIQMIDGKAYVFSCDVDDLDLLKNVTSTFHKI